MALNVDISKITGINQVGNSYQRKSAVPLDYYSLFNSKSEAEEYAASNPVSYIGQIISYVDDNEVKACIINTEGKLEDIGIIPTGDKKSISVTANGLISIIGADTADSLTLPRMKEDKSGIEWVSVSQVVEGDGNDNTTYTITALKNTDGEVYGFNVVTLFNGTAVEGGTFNIALDVYTKKEIDGKIKAIDDKIGVKKGENEATVSTGIYKDLEDLNAAISNITHFTTEIVNSTDEVTKEGVLYLIKDTSVAGVDKYNEYLFIGDEAVLIGDTTTDLSGYYTSETIEDKLKGKVDNTTLTSDYYTSETIEDKLKGKVDNTTLTSDYYTAQTIEDKLNSKVDNTTLTNDYYTAQAIDGKLSPITTKLGTIEENAEVNTIEVIKLNGTVQAIAEADRSVNLTINADTLGVATKTSVDALDKKVNGYVDEAGTTHPGLAQDLTTLSGTVVNQGTDITNIQADIRDNIKPTLDKAATKADLESAKSRILTLETTVGKEAEGEDKPATGLIKTVHDLDTTKADKTNVYTKTEIGTFDTTKTSIVNLIAAAQDTADRAYVKPEAGIGTSDLHTDVVSALNKANSAIQSVSDLATKAELGKVSETLSETKGRIDTFLDEEGLADTMDTLHDIKEWMNGEGVVETELTSAIAQIYTASSTNSETGETIPEKGILVDKITAANTYADNAAAAAVAGIPKATASALGLVRVDDETIKVDSEGVISVKKVTTDMIEQGAKEFILNGGNATILTKE